MEKKRAHTIIISDVHLGHHLCLAIFLMAKLQEWEYQQLVVLGDLSHRKCKIPDAQWPFIEYLRANHAKIIYIDGNHDPIGDAFVHEILGIEIKKKYFWQINNVKFCALHGHQFDPHLHIFSSHIWDKIFAVLCRFLKKREIQTTLVSRWFAGLYKRFCDVVAKKALRYARRKKQDVVFCGHTHHAEERQLITKKGKTIRYYNTGSGQGDKDPSIVSIDYQGNVNLHRFTNPHTI